MPQGKVGTCSGVGTLELWEQIYQLQVKKVDCISLAPESFLETRVCDILSRTTRITRRKIRKCLTRGLRQLA